MTTDNGNKGEWINPEDDITPYGEKVLVFGEAKGMNPQMGGAYISIGMRQDLKGTMLEKQADRHQDKYQFRNMVYVLQWMPLPKPPQQIINQ